MRAVTTLVSVIGDEATDVVEEVPRHAANVSAEKVFGIPDDLIEEDEALKDAWRRAQTHGSVYTLVDVDPLRAVVKQWATRLEGGPADLEVAIGLVSATSLPDYYFVPADLEGPQVHWYFGLLRRLAPARIVPVEMNRPGVMHALSHLSFGPSLPPAHKVAEWARSFIPRPLDDNTSN